MVGGRRDHRGDGSDDAALATELRGVWTRRFVRQRGKPSPKRIPVETVERVLKLYREQYFDFNVRHFHEKLSEEHDFQLSYTGKHSRIYFTIMVSQ